jgi:hypothetical protein
MKKNAPLFCLFSFLISCHSSDHEPTTTIDQLASQQTSLEPFADSLVRLNKYAPESINAAANYYQGLVPADSTLADSAAVMFLRHVSTVVDSINQQLYRDTIDYSALVYNHGNNVPEEQKQFQQNLARHHVVLQGDGEGGVYAVPDYAWINRVLQPKTSVAADSYLSLLAKEEKDPTLLDAGLAINIQELVERLIASETLMRQKLPRSFLEDVSRKQKFYTGTLLFGSDNSPALAYNELSFTEEYQKGYDYLLTTYPNSTPAQLVKEWQAIVRAKDSKKVEEWRTKYNPYG